MCYIYICICIFEREQDRRRGERKKRLCASVVCRVAKHDLRRPQTAKRGETVAHRVFSMIFSVRLCFSSCYCLRVCLCLFVWPFPVFVVNRLISTSPCFVSLCRFALLVCECCVFFFSILSQCDKKKIILCVRRKTKTKRALNTKAKKLKQNGCAFSLCDCWFKRNVFVFYFLYVQRKRIILKRMREEIFVGRSELCFGACLRSVDARARISLYVLFVLYLKYLILNRRENIKENRKDIGQRECERFGFAAKSKVWKIRKGEIGLTVASCEQKGR